MMDVSSHFDGSGSEIVVRIPQESPCTPPSPSRVAANGSQPIPIFPTSPRFSVGHTSNWPHARGSIVYYSGVVTALEAFELITHGGGTDFAQVVAVCESFGAYCL